MTKAYATYSIKARTLRGIEAVLEVEGQDYYSCGIVFVRRGGDVQAACYAEADRKAEAHGLSLQSLRVE